MEVNFLTITLSTIAAISVLISVILLIRFNWFFGWVIGSIGLGLMFIAVGASVVILSFNNYQTVSSSEPIASISFTQLAPKKYKAEISEARGQSSNFELHGDLWDISVAIISWSELLKSQGLTPYYRLAQVNGSYAMLNDASRLPKSQYDLDDDIIGFDLKTVADSGLLPAIKSTEGSSGALPMNDGALYSVRLTDNGLVVIPENKKAFESIK